MFLHLEVVQGKPTQWNATPGEATKTEKKRKKINYNKRGRDQSS